MGLLGKKKKKQESSRAPQSDDDVDQYHVMRDPTTMGTTAGYQYALQEYNNTIGSGSNQMQDINDAAILRENALSSGSARGECSSSSSSHTDYSTASGPNANKKPSDNGNRGGDPKYTVQIPTPNSKSPSRQTYQHLVHQQQQQTRRTNEEHEKDGGLRSFSYASDDSDYSIPNSPASSYSIPQYPGSPAPALHHRNTISNQDSSGSNDFGYYPPQPEMVDATYAEHYGELYTDKPIRYIYPQGYTTMRPRSRPWQIALVSCAVFAWLNVFIVGHCSERFDWDAYQDDKYAQQNFDDDAMKIATRWCGSRTLYFMWVFSVVITGLSCAYCSIIGYIKARDFAVANGRSQPPGMVGKSDYYVQIEEELGLEGSRRFGSGKGFAIGRDGIRSRGVGVAIGDAMDDGSGAPYKSYQGRQTDGEKGHMKKTIYQADGTPRFLGGHIYKPTQAAVSLTSR